MLLIHPVALSSFQINFFFLETVYRLFGIYFSEHLFKTVYIKRSEQGDAIFYLSVWPNKIPSRARFTLAFAEIT